MRRKATTEEGAGSSRPQTMRKPRAVPTDLRRTTPTATPVESETPTPSNSHDQTTPSKRPKESALVMTDEPISPELCMPKTKQEVDASKIQKIMNNFTTKCSHYFFMGRDFKFHANITQCHLVPPEKCVRAKEDAYVDWIIA